MAKNIIVHELGNTQILHRSDDGYMNATAMCKATDKKMNHYLSNAGTSDYLDALATDTGIPASQLIQVVKGGAGKQGTWVHPKVAIHLAQWLSPQFAVQVTNWVHDWMMGKNTQPVQQAPMALPDNTTKHYWLTVNSSGKVLAQVELKDSTIVSEKVDEIFPESAVLNRTAVIEDMDEIMGMMYEMTTKVSSRMNRLIPVLGTPTNATQEDVDRFWKSRVRKASDRLARAADRMESAA